MKERYCSGKERNTQAASGTLCSDQGISRNLAQCSDVSECIGMYRKVLALLFILPKMYWNVSESIGLTFHTPQNVLECIGMYWLYFSYSPECIGMYWLYFSYSPECIGMYRNVLALLFILPGMYWSVSECIGFTFHTPQDDPIHSDTFQYIHFQSI